MFHIHGDLLTCIIYFNDKIIQTLGFRIFKHTQILFFKFLYYVVLLWKCSVSMQTPIFQIKTPSFVVNYEANNFQKKKITDFE